MVRFPHRKFKLSRMKPTKQLFLSIPLLTLLAAPAQAQGNADIHWRLPLKAAGAAAQRELWGYMGSANAWPTASNGYGFMAFTTSGTPSFRDLLIDSERTLSPNGGGTLHDGLYDVIHYTQGNGILTVTHYQFNADKNWQSTIIPSTISDPTLIATETAASKVTGRVYGQFYNNALSGFEFGVVDYNEMARTTIAESTQKFVALGVTSNEEVYGVSTDGNLYHIDTKTGAERLIGSTGVEVAENSRQSYGQSGEIDQDTDVFYWACIDKNQHAALYTVDLTSGQATLIADMPHNEQILGMAIPDATPADAAPAAVADFGVAFSGGSTSGNATFTIPTKTYSGSTLSGSVSYSVTAGRRVLASGTAQAGQKVTAPVSVSEGMVYFQLTLSNSAGNAPIARVAQYVGYDEPMQPVSPRLSVSASGVANVTWGAPARGVNGGYVGPLTYEVRRNPGSVVVAAATSKLSFSETLPEQLGNYAYEIVAVNGAKRSIVARTNAVRHGSSIEPPYAETFGTQDDFNLYFAINSNGDDYTWKWHETLQCAQYEASPTRSADDWLISPPIHLQANHAYTISFQARNSLTFFTEKIEAKWGNADNVAGLTHQFLAETVLGGAEFQTLGDEIVSDKDQTIYFGIHAISDAATAKVLIDDFSIIDEGHLQGPDAVENFTVTPDAQAQLKANISFTLPKTNVNGDPVGTITKVEVERDGQVVKTFSSPTAGQTLSFEDNAPQQGINRYTVTGYTSYGPGRKAVREAWIGLDQPSAPQGVAVADTESGVRLSWNTPSAKGIHDGVVLPSGLSYNVYEYYADDILEPWQPIETELDATSCDIIVRQTGAQELRHFAVSASNASGEGDRANAPTVVEGAPYTLPFRAGFAPEIDRTLWWSKLDANPNYMFYANGQQASDGDGHCMMYTSYNPDATAELFSGKIALGGTQGTEVVFSHNGTPGSSDFIEVTVQQPGQAAETIGTVTYATISTTGWHRSSFSIPSKYASAPYVIVGFRASAPTYHAIRLDDVNVRGVLANDLAITMKTPTSVEKGLRVDVDLEVENRGTKAASGYTVTLTAGDEELYAESFDKALQPLGVNKIKADVVIPAATKGSEIALTATVSYAADEDNANNTVSELLLLSESGVPAPRNVVGSQQGDAVSLSWEQPTRVSYPTFEDFNSYDSWTIDTFGKWTTYSSNKGDTGWLWGAMGMPFEHEGEPYVFIVFVPDSIQDGITYYNHTLKPNSGDRCLMSMYSRGQDKKIVDNDDWLFSPLLSGEAQTISFFANDGESDAMNPKYSADFEVLYSTTGTRPEDFKVVDVFEQSSGRWGEYYFDVPEGANYFAIHLITKVGKTNMFLVDDATFNAGYGQLTGYNVYRDGELVASLPATATSFEEAKMPWGRHQYAVSSVFVGGESAPATSDDLVFTGITVSTVDATDAAAQPVYSLSGQRVGNYSDLSRLPKGVYIVGGKRVVVK